MANPTQRLIENVEGNFYVDVRCINCDACRQLAPASFAEAGDYSAVTRQPVTSREIREAYHALLACPTGAIGTIQGDKGALDAARADFPLPIAENVYYCGFNSEQSFGANSFFVRHPDGNWLIDSPRYLKHLVDAFDRLGGLSYMFLTHEDDVADAARYARRFGATRIIHRADAHAMPEAEEIIEGTDEIVYRPEFRIIPVPGHTEGSLCLLYRDRFLFTGDHLWWEPDTRRLETPRQLVWNADALLRSCERLARHPFEWVLAGHGGRIGLPQQDMRAAVEDLILRRQGVRT